MSWYQMDDLDYCWISTVNEERECLGQDLIKDWMLEEVIESLEYLTYVRMHGMLKKLEAQALEFDENARCDVCLSYEGEDGNELVFCDGCLLCVHQACYGITHLPEGSWICRRCEAGAKSTTLCNLCPNTGGAMKLADDGKRWCHVSCALWVPEVGFGDTEVMEPIVRLDEIPQARRNLVCCVCRSRSGAPIQCSNKKCSIAFHVTCGFQSNLSMRQELVDKEVHLIALCPKHSRKELQHPTHSQPQNSCSKVTPVKPATQTSVLSSAQSSDDSNRNQRLIELENEFHTLVDDKQLDAELKSRREKSATLFKTGSQCSRRNDFIPTDVRLAIIVYWRLKRRANFNQPLVNPIPALWTKNAQEAAVNNEENLAQAARASAEMRAFDTFRRIRFGLDRARLVVDMVLQRERRKLALFKRMMRISEIQMRALSHFRKLKWDENDYSFYLRAHIGDSVYDNSTLLFKYKSSARRHEVNPKTEVPTIPTPLPKSLGNTPTSKSQTPTTPSKTVLVLPHSTCPLRITPLKTTGKFDVRSIPQKELIVPEDIRQRLRSALALVTSNCTFGKPNPFNTSLRRHGGLESSLSESQFKETGQKRLSFPRGSNREVRADHLSFSADLCLSTPCKRSRRINSPDRTLTSENRLPVLSKFAGIKLSPSAVKLV
ncbi:unnamed protein product [Calicophoron daubneyi]